MDKFHALKQQLSGAQENVPLKGYTTFRIGGPARYFFVAKTAKDIENAMNAARKLKIPFFVLAGGSNTLIADKGFAGLVIKIQNSKFEFRNSSLWVEAGVPVSRIVRETEKRGLSGFEWAGGLPGTVGGGVRGNAGAFGGEIKDRVESVEALDAKGKRRVFSAKQCRFGYRNSIFKKRNYVVLAATFRLEKGDAKEIRAIAKSHVTYRKERHPLEYPNAGSIFKNPKLKEVPQTLRNDFHEVIKNDPFPVIPAAAFLARAKLQGLRVGGAEISRKHPNYIVNRQNASAKDVLLLIAKTKKQIQKKFFVLLEEEITFPY